MVADQAAQAQLDPDEAQVVDDIAHLLSRLSDEALNIVIDKAEAEIDSPDALAQFREALFGRFQTGADTVDQLRLVAAMDSFTIAHRAFLVGSGRAAIVPITGDLAPWLAENQAFLDLRRNMYILAGQAVPPTGATEDRI